MPDSRQRSSSCIVHYPDDREITTPHHLQKQIPKFVQHKTLFSPLQLQWSPISSSQTKPREGIAFSVFRLGNTVSSVDAAAHALQLTDPVLQLCLTGAHLSRALYFACDNLLWARAVGLAPGFDKERWGLRASSCYLLSLLLSLLRDAYVLARLAACYARERRRCRQAPPPPSSTDNGSACCHPPGDVLPSDLMEALWASPAVTLDVVKNACDLFIPLDQLGVYRSGAGVVGLCGLLSSLIGILTLLEPRLKLKP
ncbi:peroxisomal membrane protein 11A isoform X1 [Paramormyrops kingsleyae]|uniref:Peroxisomal biogenesis factor 11 alpha n=1 Tax=Paramormyrops kingsleyae TaxID=1676925 RepID=A0A3B3QBD5_9TELE|nr:peroxisomal membrane protein 11B-like isoform X1 [Paramormyrops kingsleyae]